MYMGKIVKCRIMLSKRRALYSWAGNAQGVAVHVMVI